MLPTHIAWLLVILTYLLQVFVGGITLLVAWWLSRTRPKLGCPRRILAFVRGNKLPILGIVVLPITLFLLWIVPTWQIASLKTTLGPKDYYALVNDTRTTLAQIVGGAVVLAGLYVTWRRLSATEKTVEATWKSVNVSQEGQITERFTQAIDQIGSNRPDGLPKLEIRLGGIYALERIARDSERDHWPIMEVLTAYIRENAPWTADEPAARTPAATPADIQAILTVLGRRTRSYRREGNRRLDLSRADLPGANLVGAHLEGANLTGTHLEGANLTGAHLEGAILIESHLEEANLTGTHLEEANLTGAHLEEATLFKAHLEEVTLLKAHLEEADLGETHMEGAGLDAAHLEGTYIAEAHLEGVDLFGAHLKKTDIRGANLTDVVGLTREQLESAITDERTMLPHYLRAPKQEE